MTTAQQPKTYRVHWNYATKNGTVNKRRAGQTSHVQAASPEAAAATLQARGRIVTEVREA